MDLNVKPRIGQFWLLFTVLYRSTEGPRLVVPSDTMRINEGLPSVLAKLYQTVQNVNLVYRSTTSHGGQQLSVCRSWLGLDRVYGPFWPLWPFMARTSI